MDLSDAIDCPWPGNPSNPTWPGQAPANPAWPSDPRPNGGGGGVWPGGNPTPPTQPSAPGGWPGSGPGAGPAPGGWPGSGPGAGPAPGGWPASGPGAGPAPGPAPGGWPASGPGAGPAPGGWPGSGPGAGPAPGGWPASGPGAGPAPGPAPGGWPASGPGAGPAPGGWPASGPGAGPAPGGWPSSGPGPTIPTLPQQSLTVPYNQNLPNGVYDQMLISITGTIKPNADKITLDLLTPTDLAFHFNPRFNDSGRKTVVRNSRIGRKWGKEERELRNFPFAQGRPFEIKILCTNREFKVAVNNSHLLEFKHRVTDLRSINKMSIYNDLTLSNVSVTTGP